MSMHVVLVDASVSVATGAAGLGLACLRVCTAAGFEVVAAGL